MSADSIRDAVRGILSDAGVVFSVRYVGETERPQANSQSWKSWKCDAWRFTFTRDRVKYDGDYFTGLGHRKAPPGPKPYPPYRPGTLAHEEWQKSFRPQAPHAADILQSLLLDAGAEQLNFRDWAREYGYSDDSITALEAYRQCCNIGAELRRVFSRETLNALRTATEGL